MDLYRPMESGILGVGKRRGVTLHRRPPTPRFVGQKVGPHPGAQDQPIVAPTLGVQPLTRDVFSTDGTGNVEAHWWSPLRAWRLDRVGEGSDFFMPRIDASVTDDGSLHVLGAGLSGLEPVEPPIGQALVRLGWDASGDQIWRFERIS